MCSSFFIVDEVQFVAKFQSNELKKLINNPAVALHSSSSSSLCISLVSLFAETGTTIIYRPTERTSTVPGNLPCTESWISRYLCGMNRGFSNRTKNTSGLVGDAVRVTPQHQLAVEKLEVGRRASC